MGANIFSVDYYTATVDNKPGEGSRFLTWLASEEVNLLAFTATPLNSRQTQLTIYPHNPMWLGQAARKEGLLLSGPHHCFIVHGDDELGALVEIHRKLAEASINVETSSGITDGKGGYRYIMHVEAENFDRAAKALQVATDPQVWLDFELKIRRRFESNRADNSSVMR
jgi:hypothetical protein